MSYDDDDPYNDAGDRNPKSTLRAVAVIVLACLAVFALLSWLWQTKVHAQDYLPPQRYRNIPEQQPQADEPTEYYAQDWIVKDQRGRVICRDPYVRKDLKIVECVGSDQVR